VGEEKDLIEHYLHEGEKNGNKPNELFDPIWYLDNNEDVVRAEVSPFFHYIKYGEKEGREASSSFDPKWYLKIYDDVAKENTSPMKHYLKYGKKEGRLQHKYTVANYNATDRKMNRLMPEWNENREEQFISSLEVASKDISNILVSIIMPTYNREETIKESILSVLNQSHKNFQLLIADDGSQDLTKEIVQEFDDDRINYFYQENKGVSAARNLGLKHAHGEYIFFLDSDNRWRTEYLKYMISFMEVYQLEVAYSGMALTDDFVTYNGYLGQEYDYFSLQKRNYIDLNCFGYKNISKQYLFDETIGRLVDWDFILTIGLDRPMYYAPFIGVDYFTGDSHPRITNTVVTTDEEFITLKTYIQNKNFEYLASSEIVEIDKIAIVLHLFNNSNLNYFLELLKEIYYPFDLYITTTLSSNNIIFEQFRSQYPLVTILEFIDYGSDIEAFLYLLPTLRHYKNILKLHNSNCDSIPFEMSKRIISEEIIPNLNSVLHSFETNPNLSIVGSKSLYLKEQLSEKEKFALNSIGSDKSLSNIDCGYFVSSIFYMKSHRLLNLFKYTIDGVFKTKEFIKEDSRALMKNFIILSIAKNLNSEIGLIENNQVTINEYTDYLDLSLDEMLELESEEYLRFAPDIKKGKVFFSPDYRITNPYQKLMYESLDKYYNIEAGSIENALLEQEESEKNIIFHLQWTSFIVNGDNREEIEKKISYFLEKLQLFIQKGGKVIWTIHNLISHDNKFKDLEVELCQQLSELVHYVHVHSQEIEKLVKPFYSIPKDKIIVGEHGSYFNVYPNSITHEYARKKLKIKMDSFVFLFLGQVRPYKGVEALLAAFLELEKDEQTKKIELVIAGKPVNYDLTELEKLSSLSKNIHLELREIPDEELQLFFNVADFVVTPYKQILTSGSIYLALSYSIPVIAPKKGIISEVLEENKDSFLYDDNDSNALYKTMKKSLALPSYELEEFKNNALMKSKLLTWDNMHQKLSRVFISSIVNRVQFKTLKLINGVSREILIRERASSFSNSKLGIVILHYQHIEDTIRAI
ncbi:MAG TPA: glycosyltransferase, partial [Bacteroidetes bacterium]|nr:glycosyltransferase [Bacteroidota bacterium]